MGTCVQCARDNMIPGRFVMTSSRTLHGRNVTRTSSGQFTHAGSRARRACVRVISLSSRSPDPCSPLGGTAALPTWCKTRASMANESWSSTAFRSRLQSFRILGIVPGFPEKFQAWFEVVSRLFSAVMIVSWRARVSGLGFTIVSGWRFKISANWSRCELPTFTIPNQTECMHQPYKCMHSRDGVHCAAQPYFELLSAGTAWVDLVQMTQPGL